MLVLARASCARGGCHRQQFTVVLFLSQPLARILPLHTWWFHPLQLVLVVFFALPTGADTILVLENLHCVVVFFLVVGDVCVCGGGG